MLLAPLCGLALAAGAGDDIYPSWMGKIAPVAGNMSILDWSLPGTHDSMTWDLSTTVADDTNDLEPWEAWILHDLHDAFWAAEFIKEQAQTQGLSVEGQLNTGVRFLDMRMTFTAPPSGGSGLSDYDWYSIHLVESNHKVVDYFTSLKNWLDAHPTEVVVVWLTKHGSSCPTGTDQWPGASVADKQKLWGQLRTLFGGLMFDNSKSRVNETSYNQMLARGERVVFYVADYKELTGGSETRAYDACQHLSNNLHGGNLNDVPGTEKMWQSFLKGAGAKRETLKSQDKFYLVSVAGTPPSDQIKDAAFLRYLDWFKVEKEATIKSCSKIWNMPNVTHWCPTTLEDAGIWRNYWSQRALDLPVSADGYDYPGAFYIDGVAENGLLRTGPSLIGSDGRALMAVLNRTESLAQVADIPPGNTGWAYVASLALYTTRRACKGSSSAQCASIESDLKALHDANPVRQWNDPLHGRLANWP
eukprot:Hpha_TRINITY_DN15751_c1_g9::TRINITY_DN15751_c1_g9_i1::g.40825::m.40825